MHGLTGEQRAFVEHGDIVDCKLIAVPGAGKTACILRRCDHIHDELSGCGRSMILCFQRFVADSIRARCTERAHVTVKTVDSLAWFILSKFRPSATSEMRTLSANLVDVMEGLGRGDLDELMGRYDIVFVDEAQDLNQTQHDILVHLRRVMRVPLCLVGDPAQAVYQFRQSSPRFMVDFEGKRFTLSKNFRCEPSIVRLANAVAEAYLPDKVLAVPAKPSVADAIRLHAGTPYELLNEVVRCIEAYASAGIDPSEMAILAPTKGRSESYPNLGCAQICNFLKLRGVDHRRCYDETGGGDAARKSYSVTIDHINVMTVCASKGLEFRVVFLFCPDRWFNFPSATDTIVEYTHQLYVGITRAADHLHLMGTPGHFHRAFDGCDAIVPGLSNVVDRTPLMYAVDDKVKHVHVTDIIGRTTPAIMTEFASTIINDQARHRVGTPSDADVDDAALLGLVCERLLGKSCAFHSNSKVPRIQVIERWFLGILVVVPSKDVGEIRRIVREFKSREEYEAKGAVSACEETVVDCLMPHEEWGRLIVIDRIAHSLIAPAVPAIRRAYSLYLDRDVPPEACVDAAFLLAVAASVYKSKHYLYLRDEGAEKAAIMEQGRQAVLNSIEMGRVIAVRGGTLNFSKKLQTSYARPGGTAIVHCEIDVLVDGIAMEVKSTKSDSADALLQAYLYSNALYPRCPKVAYVTNVMTAARTRVTFHDDADLHRDFVAKLVDLMFDCQ